MARSPSSPAESRKGLRSGMKRGALGESFETNSRKDNDPTGEEESSDYKHVLMNGFGASALNGMAIAKLYG